MKMLIRRKCCYCRTYFVNDRWDGFYCCPACEVHLPGQEVAPQSAGFRVDPRTSRRVGMLLI